MSANILKKKKQKPLNQNNLQDMGALRHVKIG